MTIWSYFCLNDAIIESKKRGYVNLCAYYFGKRGGYTVVFIFIITQFVAVVMYSVLSWQFIQNFMVEYNWYKFATHTNSKGQEVISNYESGNFLMRVYCLVPLAIIMLPVVLLKQ